jgi:hypothetical protein
LNISTVRFSKPEPKLPELYPPKIRCQLGSAIGHFKSHLRYKKIGIDPKLKIIKIALMGKHRNILLMLFLVLQLNNS